MSSSYRQIFKATSLIGGASLISGSVHLVQNKVVAVLLGAEGFALLEIYNSIIALISSIVNFGLGNSGVRQIAEAAGQDGPRRQDVHQCRRHGLPPISSGLPALWESF